MSMRVTFREAWSGEADCKRCTLRESALFAGLEESDFAEIHQPIDQILLQPGQTLYQSGVTGDRLFTVRSGMLKLVQYLPDGAQRIVRLVKSADVTGLEALLNQPYEHDAVAMQPTELCCLPVATVKALSKRNPELHVELLKRWHRALSEADAWLTEFSTGPARERVARLLLRLVRDNPDHECTLFGREDLGAMLGITTETASRTVAEFKRQGLLDELGGSRHRVNVAGLTALLEN
ncbi:MAG: Crp/Fnr family transcriptional regulator [Chromatiaceae bacterium]|nr:Crp/Fnr family transcriptional regulator [Gammaproteobacteria bacterium]MCP5306741.1 Crp/Fnr family transcriptional regulator [Chromatiaceae bacterium]MCP5421757.1 Crp/Fnr family transcriptional regulator [Chromatiaceae bacterium]